MSLSEQNPAKDMNPSAQEAQKLQASQQSQQSQQTQQTAADEARRDSSPILRDPFSRTGEQDTDELANMDSLEAQRSHESAGSQSQGTGTRRMSKEWDASKVPPSRFQKREGSIFSTSSSRDSHVTRRNRDHSYFEKLKEKGWD